MADAVLAPLQGTVFDVSAKRESYGKGAGYNVRGCRDP